MRVRAFTVIVLAYLLAAWLYAQQAPPKQQQDEATDEASERRGPQQPSTPARITLDGPVTVVSQPDPKQEQREAEQRAQTQFENCIQVWTLIFVAIAGVGAVAAYFANKRSADAAEKQVGLLQGEIADARADAIEQRRIANEMLNEAERSAAAMSASAEVAQQALVIAHRAFLDVLQVEITGWGESTPGIKLAVSNSGRLSGTVTSWACAVVFGALPSVPDGSQLVWSGNPGPVVPGHPIAMAGYPIDAEWPQANWKSLMNGTLRMSVWGIIHYQTGFPNTPGEIGFGFDFDPTLKGGKFDTYGKRFIPTEAPGYNYAK